MKVHFSAYTPRQHEYTRAQESVCFDCSIPLRGIHGKYVIADSFLLLYERDLIYNRQFIVAKSVVHLVMSILSSVRECQ